MRRLPEKALLWVAILFLYPSALLGHDNPEQITQASKTVTPGPVVQNFNKTVGLSVSHETNSCIGQLAKQCLQKFCAQFERRNVANRHIGDSKKNNTRFCTDTLNGSKHDDEVCTFFLNHHSSHHRKELRLKLEFPA